MVTCSTRGGSVDALAGWDCSNVAVSFDLVGGVRFVLRLLKVLVFVV